MNAEEIINALDGCVNDGCFKECKYYHCVHDSKIPDELLEDVLELLQSYQPRLLRLDEIHRGMAVWLESRDFPDMLLLAIGGSSAGGGKNFITELDVSVAPKDADYNVTWRAWTGKPTKEQMDREEWNKEGE